MNDYQIFEEIAQIVKNQEKIILAEEFKKQNAFINDTARYIDVQCSRRAGKTSGLAIRFFKTMDRHPGSTCIYLAQTKESARDIIWPVLQELNDRFKIGCTFTDFNLTMKHPNGSKLKVYGADMKNFIKRLKGRKSPGIGLDEAQDFGSHLQSLVDDVLTPMISDYPDGWLAMTGTPGPVPQGFFFEVTQEKQYGFSHHEWDIMDNPHMPEPATFLADLKKRRKWDDNHPTYLREWKNKWVLDVESLWIRYKENQAHYDTLPALPTPQKWTYLMGVDLGYKDADAIAILAYNSDVSPITYLVEEVITPKQGPTALTNQIKRLQTKYDISRIAMDTGGLGLKIAEDMRTIHHINAEAADKSQKQATVEFLNDAMRMGNFKAHKDTRFVKDSYLIQIDWDKSTPNRIEIKKTPHSDIIDAVIYAFKLSPAYNYEEPKPKPKFGSPEWVQAERDKMFESALEEHKKLQEYNKRLYGGE